MKSFIAIALLLTMSALGATAQTRANNDRADNPDMKEIRDLRLTMSNIQKFVTATKMMSADLASVRCMNDKSPANAPTLNEGEKILNTCEQAVAAIRKTGLAPREYLVMSRAHAPQEYLVMSGAIFNDLLTVSMKKQGTIKEYPPTISPENAAFIEQNFDKLNATLTPVLPGDKWEKGEK